MPTDKWGIPFIYPTKTNGGITTTASPFFYQQSDNILSDNNFNGEGDVTNSSGGVWVFETDGPTSVQIFRTSDSAQSIGGCDMHFEQTIERGYGYRADDPRDVELTFLIKFEDAGSDNGFAIEGPTGRHSGEVCCQGFSYKVDIRFQENPTQFRYRKEMYHNTNDNDPVTGVWTHPDFNFELLGHSDYVGFKYIIYAKKDGAIGTGHNTNDSMVIELWGNPDPAADITNWKLLKRTEDKGNWGNGGSECNGDDDQIGVWSNSNFRLKSNTEGGRFRLKNLSLREIDPTKSFDDDPGTPSPEGTTEIIGTFTLKRDINSLRTSTCEGAGGGGAGGSVVFYNSPLDGAGDTWGFHHDVEPEKTRIGLRAITSQSTFCNRPPIKVVEFYMDKVGSPTGTATCKIRSGGSTPVDRATIGTLDVSTLTGSPVLKTFTNASNSYVMVAGDKLIVEFTGGDAANYVRMHVRESLSETNGVYTKATFFDNTLQTWTEDGTREIPGKVWA